MTHFFATCFNGSNSNWLVEGREISFQMVMICLYIRIKRRKSIKFSNKKLSFFFSSLFNYLQYSESNNNRSEISRFNNYYQNLNLCNYQSASFFIHKNHLPSSSDSTDCFDFIEKVQRHQNHMFLVKTSKLAHFKFRCSYTMLCACISTYVKEWLQKIKIYRTQL